MILPTDLTMADSVEVLLSLASTSMKHKYAILPLTFFSLRPDNGGQANMSPGDAANLWRSALQPLAGKFRLGAPAVTSAPSGKAWLQQFFSACSGCKVSAICY